MIIKSKDDLSKLDKANIWLKCVDIAKAIKYPTEYSVEEIISLANKLYIDAINQK